MIRVAQNQVRPLVARDVSIEDFVEAAMVMRNPAGLSSDSSLSIQSRRPGGTEPIVEAAPAAMATFTPSNLKIDAAIPQAFRRIRFSDGYLTESLTLGPDLGADYTTNRSLEVRRTSSTAPISVLTLQGGTRIHFKGGELVVGTASSNDLDGSLIANGTAAAVVLTSEDAVAHEGQWSGLMFHVRSAGPQTALKYLRVENAGGPGGTAVQYCQTSPSGAIKLRGSLSNSYAGPDLQNIEILRSSGDGLAFSCVAGGCLTTDYASAITGTDIAGELLRPLTCR